MESGEIILGILNLDVQIALLVIAIITLVLACKRKNIIMTRSKYI